MRDRLRLILRILNTPWFKHGILLPFIATRLAWIVVAAFARGSLALNPSYPELAERGGMLTRHFLLDIFAHWDTRYYLSIIQEGYSPLTDFVSNYRNVAFYPLYPYLVKSIGWLGVHLPTGLTLLIGILLSNVCFLAAAALLYRLATGPLGLADGATRNALLLLFAFPGNFFFSSFYPESLFLLLALAAFTAAMKDRWALAGALGALATLARIQGAIVVIALAWLYLDQRRWSLRELRPNLLWLGLAPLALAGHFYTLYRRNGHFWAALEAQAAWGRSQYGFFEGLWRQLSAPVLDVYKIDLLLALLFLACGLALLRRAGAWRALGIFTILCVLMPLSTGLLVSVSRFLAPLFPVYLLLAEKWQHRPAFALLAVLWFALQVIYFAGWANFYWIA